MSEVANSPRETRSFAPGPGVSVPEAAKELKMTETAVRKDIRDGRLRSVRVGGRDRIPHSALLARKAELK